MSEPIHGEVIVPDVEIHGWKVTGQQTWASAERGDWTVDWDDDGDLRVELTGDCSGCAYIHPDVLTELKSRQFQHRFPYGPIQESPPVTQIIDLFEALKKSLEGA